MTVGTVVLAGGLLASLVALGATAGWASGRAALRPLALGAARATALAVGAAGLLHLANLLTHQFQYAYVASFSDRALAPLLLIASFWAGQAGSFLLWSLLSALFVLALARGLRASPWRPFVLAPALLVTAAVIGITWASDPFRLLDRPPADGSGLNPLLQNPWMVLHPPFLFLGFTAMTGPFAFAVAALWRHEEDAWGTLARPWALVAWISLGLGLTLGGVWAYESLGWGGFWGWDPVENSSLVPWLAATALLHGLILQGARGGLKRGNLALALLGELTMVYSTFLTRSGVLGQFSVHSFAELGLMGYLAAFLAGFAVLGFGLLAWRWRGIGRRVGYTRVLSREFGLLISTVLLLAVLVVVLLGTSMPLISLLPGFGGQVALDTTWYGTATAPFALLIALTAGIAPWLAWGRSHPGALLSALRWPAALTGVALLGALLLNVIHPPALLLIAGAVFAAAANAAFALRVWRGGLLKLGGPLCHVGVGLLLLGAVGNAFYKQSAALQLTKDVPQQVFGRQVVFRDLTLPSGNPPWQSATQVEVTTARRGDTWVAEPPYYNDPKSGKLIVHPAIQRGAWGDLYLQPSQYVPAAQVAPGAIILGEGETRALLGYTLTFARFDLSNQDAMIRGEAPPQVGIGLRVQTPNGATRVVTPTLSFGADQQPLASAVALGGGATLVVREVDATNKLALLQLGGVDLSQVRADDLKPRLFLQVSTEPGIGLVWLGMAVGLAGGLLALLRRWIEARAQTARAPADDRASALVGSRQLRVAHAARERGTR